MGKKLKPRKPFTAASRGTNTGVSRGDVQVKLQRTAKGKVLRGERSRTLTFANATVAEVAAAMRRLLLED